MGKVEEGIELLTGVAAGEKQDDGLFPEGTVFARVAARLEEIRDALKEESESDKDDETKGNDPRNEAVKKSSSNTNKEEDK